MASYWDKLKKSFDTFLSRWNGGDVRLWDYTCSHRKLTLRATKLDKSGYLHIACIGVKSLSLPAFWTQSNFEVECDFQDGYILMDLEAGCEIRADHIEMSETTNVTEDKNG